MADWKLLSLRVFSGAPRIYRALIFLLPRKGLKQLRWEAERDDWLHNRDVKSIIKRKKNFRKRPRTTQKMKKQRKSVFSK